jgi:MFS family permease
MTLTFSAWTGVSAYYTDSTSGGSSGNHQAAIGVVALIFIYYLFYNTQHPMIYVYLVEILPFSIRAKGFTVQQFFSRGGSAFNQFVNPIGLESVGWRFYFVYIVSVMLRFLLWGICGGCVLLSADV